jgi:hypothetical protein
MNFNSFLLIFVIWVLIIQDDASKNHQMEVLTELRASCAISHPTAPVADDNQGN